MQSLRVLTDGDQELTSFLQEIRATLVAPPTGAVASALPARLAAEARAATPSANGRGAAGVRPRRALSRPLPRIALAVAAIPLLSTGLAFAGVNLPSPASSAFESIGIDLPNQPENDRAEPPAGAGDAAGTAHDGDSAGSAIGQSNSSGKVGGGQAKQNPVRAEGHPGDGRVVGQEAPVPGGGEAPANAGSGSGNGGGSGGNKGTGKPESTPGGGPQQSTGPPENPGSQGKSPGGVQKKGSSGSEVGAADPGAGGGKTK